MINSTVHESVEHPSHGMHANTMLLLVGPVREICRYTMKVHQHVKEIHSAMFKIFEKPLQGFSILCGGVEPPAPPPP